MRPVQRPYQPTTETEVYIIRETKYCSTRPFEVVQVSTNRVTDRYATMAQAMRRVRVLKKRGW